MAKFCPICLGSGRLLVKISKTLVLTTTCDSCKGTGKAGDKTGRWLKSETRKKCKQAEKANFERRIKMKTEIQVAQGQEFSIVQPDEWNHPKGTLAYLDIDNRRIEIKKDQPEVGKYWVLFHEMTHLALVKIMQMIIDGDFPMSESAAIEMMGVIESEPFVEMLSGALFSMLASSDMIKNVSKKEFEEFFEEAVGEEERRKT